MRGDRPYRQYEIAGILKATPHARGSTWSLQRCLVSSGGYPACAGIDLFLVVLVDGGGATPHARGSTLILVGFCVTPQGYPACAGIDLCCKIIPACDLGLPRMRGDRPIQSDCIALKYQATPHARGSTLNLFRRFSIMYGYPACAGIDP